MSAQQNKQNAQNAYAAFGNSDAEGAMRDIDDSIAWTERGDNALTGTHDGKQAVGELWGKLMSKDFRTTPHDFVAEGDKVVVLTTRELDGEVDRRRRRADLQRRRQVGHVRGARRPDADQPSVPEVSEHRGRLNREPLVSSGSRPSRTVEDRAGRSRNGRSDSATSPRSGSQR